MKININIEVDTDKQSDIKTLEEIMELLQQLKNTLQEKEDER